MEGDERMQTLDAPVGLPTWTTPYSGDPDAVAPQVLGVDPVHGLGADFFLGPADTAFRLDAGDRRHKARARHPERGRHLAAGLVLDHARQTTGTARRYPKRRGLSP